MFGRVKCALCLHILLARMVCDPSIKVPGKNLRVTLQRHPGHGSLDPLSEHERWVKLEGPGDSVEQGLGVPGSNSQCTFAHILFSKCADCIKCRQSSSLISFNDISGEKEPPYCEI